MFDYLFYRYLDGPVTAIVVTFVLGLVLGSVITGIVVPKHKRVRFLQRPSLLYFHDFLNFKRLWSLPVYKWGYICSVCALTMFSFYVMFAANFLAGLLLLTFGNLLLRIFYEFLLVFFSIHDNLNDIANKITGRSVDPGGDVSASEFFSDMGTQLKAQKDKIQSNMQEYRAKQEAERRYYEQQAQQYQQPQQPYQPQYQQPQQQPYSSAPQGAAPASAERQPNAVCKACGTHLDGSGAFCPSCGAPV